jgi:hypothetical protein
MGDKSMPTEEQTQQKGSAYLSPQEFRNIRDDLPKLKS